MTSTNARILNKFARIKGTLPRGAFSVIAIIPPFPSTRADVLPLQAVGPVVDPTSSIQTQVLVPLRTQTLTPEVTHEATRIVEVDNEDTISKTLGALNLEYTRESISIGARISIAAPVIKSLIG
ncbi:UNVERIFIED_CONTAM: hypothetical protein Slati_2112200 [Sesamum latifolium]|uniref:Uncharacterized protein n=1 Tax=Sesamum latifolium TaxID=2727402 RepID=A0AAW2WUY4_9LAMI